MTERGGSPPPARGEAPRQVRPRMYSRGAWLLMRALDPLPWPWGENIMAGLFAAKAPVRPFRLRHTLAWAGRHAVGRRARWRLALSCCAHHGRFLARQALLGIETPDDLRRHVAVEGAERLADAARGAVLVGFHLGPPGASMALRAAGYPVTWVGGPRAFRTRTTEPWRRFEADGAAIAVPLASGARGALLYAVRRRLLAGGLVYMAAEGGAGRDAFELAVPGGRLRGRSGWFVLSRQCAVPVLPVTSHLEGLTQVITIHPPLPAPGPDPSRDLEACRAVLEALVRDYTARFPEQCYALAFPPRRRA